MEKSKNQVSKKANARRTGIVDEVVVRYSNKGFSPNPTKEMRMSTGKSNCKGDYGCCGALP